REYKKVVFTWTFLIGTLLAPLMASMFAIVPMIIFSIKGEVQRIVLVDLSENKKVATRLKENLSPAKISEKAKEAAKESFRNMDASQEEKMRNGATQLGESFAFVDYNA